MITPKDIVNEFPPHPTITMQKLREAVEKSQRGEEYDFCVFTLKPCAYLQGMQTLVISDGKVHYWSDLLNTGNVKIIELPPMSEPVPQLNWCNLNDNL